MGRRVRHFNPVAMGAGCALDARFITGLSNGNNVTSWSSRPGVTFTFTETSNYPTYSASVSGAGNQPGVSFNAGSNQRLVATAAVVAPGSNTFTYIEFTSAGSSGFISISGESDRSVIGCQQVSGNSVIFHRGYFDWRNSSNVAQTLLEGTYSTGQIAYGRNNGTAQDLGNGLGTPLTRTSAGTLRSVSGSGLTDFRTGVLHASALFAFALTDAQLRRMQYHYAFCFKRPI